MTEPTPLDTAHAAMQAAPEDDAARLRFYDRLADADLVLLLTEEPRGDSLSPDLFDLPDGRFVLAFDDEERLVAFTGRPTPYAALSGRMVVAMLAGQGIGLGLNLDVAPSSILIPAEAMDWLAETLARRPDLVETRIARVSAPGDLPADLMRVLEIKLARAAGLAASAHLVGVVRDDGRRGHLLGFVDAQEGAQAALAKAVSEALVFSGLDGAALDVGFFATGDAMADRIVAAGAGLDLTPPPAAKPAPPAAPGSDPAKPPILR